MCEDKKTNYESTRIVKVAIAGKRTLDKIGIRSILGSIPDMVIAGQFQDDETLLLNLRHMQVDILVWCLVHVNHQHKILLKQLIECTEKLSIICVVPYTSPRILHSFICEGCQACVLQDDVEQDLILALQHVVKRQHWLSPRLMKEVYFSFSQLQARTDVLLEERELIIAQLLTEGYRNHDIADKVGLTTKSVERLLTTMYRKIRVHSRTEAVAFFTQEGFFFD